MEKFLEVLPYIIPVLGIQLVLIIVALVDLSRREKTYGPKWMWVLIILFVNLFGAIIYFILGRQERLK